MSGNGSEPRNDETVAMVSSASVAHSNIVGNDKELSHIVVRLAQLLPPGGVYDFRVHLKTSSLVLAGGTPVGETMEIIQIVRPAFGFQKHFDVTLAPKKKG